MFIQIAFIDIQVSWFYLGYSLKPFSLNENHIKRAELLSTYLLIFAVLFLSLGMVLSCVLILNQSEIKVNYYSIFTVLIFYVICVVYIVGGLWMLKLMKWILVPARYKSCQWYLLKIIISGSVVSFVRGTFNLSFVIWSDTFYELKKLSL